MGCRVLHKLDVVEGFVRGTKKDLSDFECGEHNCEFQIGWFKHFKSSKIDIRLMRRKDKLGEYDRMTGSILNFISPSLSFRNCAEAQTEH